MRNVIWLVLLFAVAVVAALTLGDNSGLASFYWDGWRLDISLNFFLIAVLAGGFAVVTAIQAVNALVGLPARAREWRALRLERAAQSALRQAMTEFFGGRYSRSHKAAQRAATIRDDVDTLADDHEFQMLANLMAAGSLHRLQDRRRRDEWLDRALKLARRHPGAPMGDGARLLAAEWALDDRDSPRATELLAELPPGTSRRTQALRLKLQAARLERRPLDALHTARLLAHHQAFSAAAAQGLLRSLAIEALEAAHDAEQLRRIWQQFDVADQRDAFVASRAARRAAQLGQPEEGRQWLRPLWDRMDTLGADGRAEVAMALADASQGLGTEWLARAEAVQRAYPAESAVQAGVGAVLMACRLWGKARRPLEQATADASLAARARRRAWRQLAQLAEEEGDSERAQAAWRRAADID